MLSTEDRIGGARGSCSGVVSIAIRAKGLSSGYLGEAVTPAHSTESYTKNNKIRQCAKNIP